MAKEKERITFKVDGFGSISGTLIAPDGYSFSMKVPKTREAKAKIRTFLYQQESEYCALKGLTKVDGK